MTAATWLREERFAARWMRTNGVHGRVRVVAGEVTEIEVRAMGTPESVDRLVWRREGGEGGALVIEDEVGWTQAGGVRAVQADRVPDGLVVTGTPTQMAPQIGDGVRGPDPAVLVDAVVIEVVVPRGTRVGIGSPDLGMCTYSVGIG